MSSWKRRAVAATAVCGIMLILWGTVGRLAVSATERPAEIPPPALDNPKAAGPAQTVVLAGGCFWGVQAVFQHLNGVQRALSGYAGGEASWILEDNVRMRADIEGVGAKVWKRYRLYEGPVAR
jgi:peptide-methionine (S)-S-oxide reductase